MRLSAKQFKLARKALMKLNPNVKPSNFSLSSMTSSHNWDFKEVGCPNVFPYELQQRKKVQMSQQMETDRQTDRDRQRQAGRHAGRQTDRQTDRQASRQTDKTQKLDFNVLSSTEDHLRTIRPCQKQMHISDLIS